MTQCFLFSFIFTLKEDKHITLSFLGIIITLFSCPYQHGLSAVVYYFSLTAKQSQPAYKSQKQPIIFLSQQNSHSRLISHRNSLPNRVNIITTLLQVGG
jgi:hypothetical protein